jgi:hypothetical protein
VIRIRKGEAAANVLVSLRKLMCLHTAIYGLLACVGALFILVLKALPERPTVFETSSHQLLNITLILFILSGSYLMIYSVLSVLKLALLFSKVARFAEYEKKLRRRFGIAFLRENKARRPAQ